MRSLQSCQVSQVLHLPAVTRLLQKKKKHKMEMAAKHRLKWAKGHWWMERAHDVSKAHCTVCWRSLPNTSCFLLFSVILSRFKLICVRLFFLILY